MKKTFIILALCAFVTGNLFAQKNDTERMLDRYLSYVKIESQSQYPDNPNEFPMQEGQKAMATFIFNEIKSIGKGIEEMVELTGFCKAILVETSKLINK